MIKTDKGHFWLTFENGYTISVFNGYGSYSENHFKSDLSILMIPKEKTVDSKDCEVAVMYKDEMFCTDRFIDCDGNDVIGYISADELADLIIKVKEEK